MHVLLQVGELRGEPQFEPVHVEERGEGVVQVVFSPGLAYEFAAGDTIKVDESGRYEVTERAGNVAVRVYFREPIGDRLDTLKEQFAALDGTLDGQVKKGAVFTLPARDQIPMIESVMHEFVTRNAGCVWEFGNVYDSNGEPLEWCKHLVSAGEA